MEPPPSDASLARVRVELVPSGGLMDAVATRNLRQVTWCWAHQLDVSPELTGSIALSGLALAGKVEEVHVEQTPADELAVCVTRKMKRWVADGVEDESFALTLSLGVSPAAAAPSDLRPAPTAQVATP